MNKEQIEDAKRQLKAQIDQLYRAVHRADVAKLDVAYLAKTNQAIDVLISRFRTWGPESVNGK